jgi:hypothetical protein
MIPPRRPIPRASFEEILLNGPVGDLQKKQLQGHRKRRQEFLTGFNSQMTAKQAEAHLVSAMQEMGLTEADLWRVLADGAIPAAADAKRRLKGLIDKQVTPNGKVSSLKPGSPVTGSGFLGAKKKRTKKKRTKKKRKVQRPKGGRVIGPTGQTRKPGSHRSSS